MTQFQEDLTNRLKDGQTVFYMNLPAEARGPKLDEKKACFTAF